MLFVIDMQNDFVDPSDGKMAVKDADKLIPGILNKIKEYEDKDDVIFYTLNIHGKMPDDTRSKEEREWGQELYQPLKQALKDHNPIKKYYYGISPNISRMIEEKFKDNEIYIKTIELVGVETNICILSNAIILQNIFPDAKLIVDENLCTSNDLQLHKDSLNVMEGLGIEVKRT